MVPFVCAAVAAPPFKSELIGGVDFNLATYKLDNLYLIRMVKDFENWICFFKNDYAELPWPELVVLS